jgi:lysozyme
MSEDAESALINSVPLTVNPSARLSLAAYTSIVGERPLGASLSHFNGVISDFAALKDAGLKFCFFKATQGISRADPEVHTFAAQASQVSMPFGLYHFFDVAADGQTQAENFLKVTADLSPSLPPMLDLEEIPNKQVRPDLAQQVGRFLNRLKSDGKPNCVIYSSKDFLDRYFPNGIDNYSLCLARFATEASAGSVPALPKGWKKATFWHFTDEAPDTRLKGIDLFVFDGTDEQLRDPLRW